MKPKKGIRVQMPVDVAVVEPQARVVGEEADGDLIICGASANAHNVVDDRVDPVVPCCSRYGLRGVCASGSSVNTRKENCHESRYLRHASGWGTKK